MSLQTLYVVVALTTVLANAGMAVADLAGARFVLANSAEVGLPRSWVPGLGALKAAGAAGLVLGLAGLPLIGLAAAAGLVLFFMGALAKHALAGVYHNIAFPGAFLALAAATLGLGLATG
ncbi:DoxX family protein [Dactylosporangium sp. NPDC000555]|uniref:DoxX family protein n=1 Tax=Dactylosporangium sp. NPDC000555 TaxID=3154260 RepID=UPI003320AA73